MQEGYQNARRLAIYRKLHVIQYFRMERNVMYMYQNNQEPSVPQSQNFEAYQTKAFMINDIYNKYSTLIGYINENV